MSDSVPHGWTTIAASELFSFITSGSRGWAAHYADEGAKFIRVQNVRRGRIDLDLDDVQHVQPPNDAEGVRTRLKPGDLVITITADLGRVGLVPSDLGEAYVNQHVALARPIDPQLSPYLAWFVTNPSAQEQLGLFDRGATRAGLGLKDIGAVLVPLPPLAEQRRIVARIEALFARTRRARADLERVGSLAKHFRRRLLRTRLDAESHGWPVATIADVSDNHDGRRVPLKESERAKRRGEFPYYGASGQIDTINDYLFDGDFLLISEDGANLLARSTPIAFRASGRFWVNNHAHIVSPKQEIRIDFLEHAIEAIDLEPFVTGSAQPKLTQRALNAISIPFPSLADQAEAAAKIDCGTRAAQMAEHEATRALALLDRLEQSILARAFRSELVAQDPADETAAPFTSRPEDTAPAPPSARRRRGRPPSPPR